MRVPASGHLSNDSSSLSFALSFFLFVKLSSPIKHFALSLLTSKYFVQHKLMQSTVYFEIVCVGESLSDNTQEAVFSCSIGNTDININKR